jgi:hypothetical protein
LRWQLTTKNCRPNRSVRLPKADIARETANLHIQSMSEYEWATRPPSTAERVIAGLFVAVLLLSSASSYSEWNIFGGYDRQVADGSMIFGLILMRLLLKARRKPPG